MWIAPFKATRNIPAPSITIVVGLLNTSSQFFSWRGDVFNSCQDLIIARVARGIARYANMLRVPKSVEWIENGKILVYVPPVINNVGQNKITPGSKQTISTNVRLSSSGEGLPYRRKNVIAVIRMPYTK
jgi:hypothetical protein